MSPLPIEVGHRNPHAVSILFCRRQVTVRRAAGGMKLIDGLRASRYCRVMVRSRQYRYVGPAELCEQVVGVDTAVVDMDASLDVWLGGLDCAERTEPSRWLSRRTVCSGWALVAMRR
jgi:hypothetical protein